MNNTFVVVRVVSGHISWRLCNELNVHVLSCLWYLMYIIDHIIIGNTSEY